MSRPARKRFLTPFSVAAVLLVVLAALLRLAASRGDFWLDEIWSWTFARQASSALDIFTSFAHDNNHILNTLFLYFLGDQFNWVVYRIPSVLAGVATVVVAALIGRRSSRLAALTAMLLTSCSFLLVLYGSEARGYAFVVFFALLSLYTLERYVAQPGWTLAVLFWVATALGLLSHLTYLHCYVGLFAWSVYRLASPGRGWRCLLADLGRCHAVPLVALAVFYLGYVRRMELGGGPPYSVANVLCGTLSLAVGGPESGRAAWAIALVASLAISGSLLALWSGPRDRWVPWGVAIVLSPALVLLFYRPVGLFPRYFLVPVAFFLVLASQGLARLYRRSTAGKVVYLVLLTAFLGANAVHLASLLKYERGHYLDALRYMASHTSGPLISVGGDHDFRNGMVIQFYTRYLPTDKHMFYYDANAWPAEGSEWFLIHSQTHDYVPRRAITVRGIGYRLAGEYPFSELSGWNWYVYHNVANPF